MMDSSGAVEYIYAKTSGMLAKAFVGRRANKLFQAKNLADLWQTVFNSPAPTIPENLLAQSIEKEAENRFLKEYISLVDSFDKPEPVALQLLRSFDYSNIKKLNFALRTGEKDLPDVTNIGRFSQIKYKAWPKIAKMTEEGCFSWVTDVVETKDVLEFEHKLDAQYVLELWQAVKKTKGEAKEAIEELIREQLILNNIVWAIRLKLYYNMEPDDILKNLAGSGTEPLKKDILIEPVLKIINKPLDIYSEWASWNYADLLNPADDVTAWTIDPRYLQRAANMKINKMALRMFHKYPCSSAILVPWFKIRELELDYICTAAEGLRLDVGEEQTREFAGV
ncbi:MAG: V-type ATPase subunit [Spirochaetaceae bacterium]|nr:V-type ATPase subunit [Spirochaetaceae bacterium]